ncbi:prepilin peptidase [Pelagibius sp. CAU 1746]|uniref:prepilin peptidase n=1 Tax=Pelagibius sp. CAU 1746 TaxID=3140370 RepID=UPI00325A4D62
MPTLSNFFLPSTLLAAPFIGSFLGTLILRLPEGRPVVFDRSRCEACGQVLGALDQVPVFSWLAFKGRCRHCGTKLGVFYPLIELAALGVALWAAFTVPPHLVWPTAALGWVLLVLAAIDAKHFLLPDVLTLPLIPAGLAVAWWLDPAGLPGGHVLHHALGAALGFLGFAAPARA